MNNSYRSSAGERIESLRDAKSTLDEARRCYHEAVRAAFPVGSRVHSGKCGRGIIGCTVLRHGSEDRLFVRSDTGREYWIAAYWVQEAGFYA